MYEKFGENSNVAEALPAPPVKFLKFSEHPLFYISEYAFQSHGRDFMPKIALIS